MTTSELALRTSTPYFIEYVYENNGPYFNNEPYFQLVRTKDQAILHANKRLYDIYAYCFSAGIAKEQTTLDYIFEDKVTLW